VQLLFTHRHALHQPEVAERKSDPQHAALGPTQMPQAGWVAVRFIEFAQESSCVAGSREAFGMGWGRFGRGPLITSSPIKKARAQSPAANASVTRSPDGEGARSA
jgi:hypothetical protein